MKNSGIVSKRVEPHVMVPYFRISILTLLVFLRNGTIKLIQLQGLELDAVVTQADAGDVAPLETSLKKFLGGLRVKNRATGLEDLPKRGTFDAYKRKVAILPRYFFTKLV